ncbi:MAG: hypothetical protein PVI13_05770 [Desulfobacterales bacterium]|jgi:hypothetical protein
MSIMSLQEIMLVLSAAVVLIAYHTHLYKKVRRDPLKTAVGVTNPAGFMINTFEQNDATVSEEAVTKVLNHGALHYTIGMRGGLPAGAAGPVAVRSALDVGRQPGFGHRFISPRS